MQARQFEQFLQRLSSLTRRQRDRLLDLLQSAAGLDRVLEIVEQPATPLCCPHCQTNNPYRHGHAHGLQRYRCCSCHRTFNALSGTSLARLRYRHSRGRSGFHMRLSTRAPAKESAVRCTSRT